MNTLPTISRQTLDAVSGDAAELIYLLVSHYREIISADASGQVQNEFSAEQNILMAYEMLDGQVANGGFIQLIENGFGAFIFDTPVSDYLRDWGLGKTSSIIDRARIIYESKRAVLEREKTLEEFARMYSEHPEFEPLDSEYAEIADSQRQSMAQYIIKHIGDFAIIEQ